MTPNLSPRDQRRIEQAARVAATRRFAPARRCQLARAAIALVDLTLLDPHASADRVRQLCRHATAPAPQSTGPVATRPPVAAVCVLPAHAALVREALAGSTVRVAVATGGFPRGDDPLPVKLDQIRHAAALGADEIDMVANWHALQAGDEQSFRDELRAVARCSRDVNVTLKVILETGSLQSLPLIARAAALAIEAIDDAGLTDQPGRAFVKTSTGAIVPGATLPAAAAILHEIARHAARSGRWVGCKPAGGIRTTDQALAYLDLAEHMLGPLRAGSVLDPRLLRLGASALLDELARSAAAAD